MTSLDSGKVWKSAIHLHRRMQQLQQQSHTGPIESHLYPVGALLAKTLSISFLLLESPMPSRETTSTYPKLMCSSGSHGFMPPSPTCNPTSFRLNDFSAAKKQPKPLPGISVAGRYELRGLHALLSDCRLRHVETAQRKV